MAKLIIDDSEIDTLVWEIVKDSSHIADLESYLNLFSSLVFATAACNRLDNLLHNNVPARQLSNLPSIISAYWE